MTKAKRPASPDGPAVQELDRAADTTVTGTESGGPRYATPKVRGRGSPTHKVFDPDRMCGFHLKNCPVCSLEDPDSDVPWRDCPHNHDTSACSDNDHRCRKAKGWGTDHTGSGNCRNHLGTTPTQTRIAAEEAAQKALLRFGVEVEIEPVEGLRRLVWMAWGSVLFLRERVNELGERDGTPNLVGDVFGIDRFGDTHAISEDARAYVKLYLEERKHLKDVCKAAIDAGLAEREVKLAESQATMIVRVIEVTLAGIGATPEQYEQGRKIASGELALIAASHPERN